jgi:uncharacterized protein (TIGR02246 family)
MRMRLAFVFVMVLFTFGTRSLAQQSGPSPADLDKFNASFAAGWAKGDGQAVAAHYTDDAVRIGVGQDTQVGRAAIAKYFAGTLAGPSKGSKIVLKVQSTKVLSPDAAIVLGTFEVTGAGARNGRYVNTITRTASGWLIAASGVVQDSPMAK